MKVALHVLINIKLYQNYVCSKSLQLWIWFSDQYVIVILTADCVPADDDYDDEDDEDDETANESWAGWAWSLIPSVLPYYSEEDWNSDQQAAAYGGHTYHTGFYVKHASVILKVYLLCVHIHLFFSVW